MIRRILGVVAAVAAVGSVGCGGSGGDRVYEHEPPRAEADVVVRRAYVGVTNRVTLHDAARTRLEIGLVPGSRVDLEVAAVDGEELHFRLLRQRADGSLELVNPVITPSGFKLTRVHAKSGGPYLIDLPASAAPRDIVVWFACEDESTRCAAAPQPGDTCYRGVACDQGLECRDAAGACDPLVEPGTCTPRSTSAPCDGPSLR